MQIRLRTCVSALALSSALAAFASPAAAVPTNTSGQTAVAPKPIPAASWHGRPIRSPDRAGIAVVAVHRGPSAPSLAFGAGYGHPGGSTQVREIQRLLLRIGYRPGMVDGMFGPLTRSSVQWFQTKHSLRPTGVVDAATLALLRLRAHGASPSAMPTTAPPQTASPPAASPAPAPSAPAAPPAPAAPATPGAAQESSGSSAAPAVIAASAAALALLLSMLLLLRSRRSRREAPPAPPEQPSASEPTASHSPAARPSERVVGYASGRHPRDVRQQAETIERACSERGWALAQVVRERRNGNGHRPGLRFALDQLAKGRGTALVACRVRDVGRNPEELAALLGWCSRTGVDLVALDVGLDTSTRSGKIVARSLVKPPTRMRFGRSVRRRRGKAPGVDGELAPSSSP